MCDFQCPAGRLGGVRVCPALAASLAVTLYASIRKVACIHPPKLQTLTALQVCWLAQVAAHCQRVH